MSLLFSSLPLSPDHVSVLTSLGLVDMTPIQQQSLPESLQGQDILAQAPTGSGKTIAFSLPLIKNLQPRSFAVQALVLCPTRELASQVAEEIRRLAKYPGNIKVLTLCGGQPIGPQIGSLAHGAHVIVGTPGRVSDHLRKKTLDLSKVSTLVLDEADRMLDMGFKDDILAIVALTPKQRQSMLFSATYPADIKAISSEVLRDPKHVAVNKKEEAHEDIEQRVYESAGQGQLDALLGVLSFYQPEAGIIFCNTREQCNDLSADLKAHGVNVGVLHGDLEQRQRDQILIRFTNGSLRFLIATDVAARGLDIPQVDVVINDGLPRDIDVFTHRSGRTGRAGRKGLVISIIGPKEQHKLDRINQQFGLALHAEPAPRQDMSALASLKPAMRTLELDRGRKHKMRPGDIVGALTATKEITGADIGQISIQDMASYVALPKTMADLGVEILKSRPIKGKGVRARKI
ncbi:MAG TPA: ATP-dependent RNA helicase DbpA [Pseudomonadales bacterium]|nr:ATP-dependent RNA helicase DbpA [Pseudomonadales bacterium]